MNIDSGDVFDIHRRRTTLARLRVALDTAALSPRMGP